MSQAIRYLRQENAGPAAARNAAITMALGDLLAFQDADRTPPPGQPDPH